MQKYPHIATFLVVVAFTSCQPAKQSHETSVPPGFHAVLREAPGFSGVILVAEKGTPVYHEAFGHLRFDTQEPLDTNAVFELASVSKQFTAMIIMMLAEQGLLSYDDTIGTFIPGLPYRGVTIRNLLNHTSGLPDYQAVMDAHWDKSKVAGNEDNITFLKKYKPAVHFSPGEKYEYSNTGYMLLASIAERAAGRDFIELCNEWIFGPLEMTQTDIRTKRDKVSLENMAWGHLWVPEKSAYIHADSFPDFNYSIWLGNRKGPGRLSSTASDLLKWDQALYRSELVKKATIAEGFSAASLTDGRPSQYGFGWMLAEHPALGKKVLHTGNNPGYKTIIIRYIDSGKTIIVLCNNAHEKFNDVVKGIEDALAEREW
jgi:CubicO group peptidase (beta-lactamase class C family)